MLQDENRINYFAEADFRNSKTKFGIKAKDRTKHMYVIGKTGMGKSALLENMAAQDILNGEGFAFVDPHGSAIENLLDYIPEHRIRDVVYFAPFDTDYPIAFNVMEDVGPDSRHLVANGLLSSFKKIWQDSFSARMEYILSNTILALLEYPDSTLLSINRMLAEKPFRMEILKYVKDATVKAFWVDEFNKWDERYAREAAAAIQNKVGQFTANPLIRNIVGQKKSSFDLRKIMDEGKILLINLSKGRIGEQNGKLLGGMLITKLYIAAMSRAEEGEEGLKRLPHFYLYVDEFQNFANESFSDILSEARKYKLNLTIAHQYVEQMPEEVKEAVLGNVGTMVTFRVGATDAELFEKEFSPVFTAQDIVNLGFAQIYLRLMIDGIGSKPFSARTLPPITLPEVSYRDNVIGYSRMKYAVSRQLIEGEIQNWYEAHSNAKEEKTKKTKSKKKESIQTFTPKPNTKTKVSSKLNGLLDGLEKDKSTDNKSQKETYSNQKKTQTKNKKFTPTNQKKQNFDKKPNKKESVNNTNKTAKKVPGKASNNALKDVISRAVKNKEIDKDKNTQDYKQIKNQARTSDKKPDTYNKPKEISEERLKDILR